MEISRIELKLIVLLPILFLLGVNLLLKRFCLFCFFLDLRWKQGKEEEKVEGGKLEEEKEEKEEKGEEEEVRRKKEKKKFG